ncbi:hypothetical protein [Frankia sp. R82]|uniref:hypothetical protein n=1 Tax=Frankia sp. R82 TaxID=2950553 RepID=UPI002044B983|nr:hypothetical protein [Frankia sp. R82]MCM3884132.1 hypothetical protein [Frankia sp. R82]
MIDTTDIADLYEPWITAVRGGQAGIERLLVEQPDLGTPEQIVRDVLTVVAPAITNPELREATLQAARDVQAALDRQATTAAPGLARSRAGRALLVTGPAGAIEAERFDEAQLFARVRVHSRPAGGQVHYCERCPEGCARGSWHLGAGFTASNAAFAQELAAGVFYDEEATYRLLEGLYGEFFAGSAVAA